MLDPRVSREFAAALADTEAKLCGQTFSPKQAEEDEGPREAIGGKRTPGRRTVDDAGQSLGREQIGARVAAGFVGYKKSLRPPKSEHAQAGDCQRQQREGADENPALRP